MDFKIPSPFPSPSDYAASSSGLRERNKGKSPEQIEAERVLAAFIPANEQVVATIVSPKEGGRRDVNDFIMSRGFGRWGLLLSPAQTGDGYKLWYVENNRVDIRDLKLVSINLNDPSLEAVNTCLRGQVISTLVKGHPKMATESESQKLATLIYQGAGIIIDPKDIDNEAKSRGDYLKVPLESLLEKG